MATTTNAIDARTLYQQEKAKREAQGKALTLAQRAKLAVGIGANRKPISEDEKARRDRCKSSRSIVRKYMRALAASTDDTLDADVRGYWADKVNELAPKYEQAEAQLAKERKR